jgi:hypothetical protein
MSAPPPALTTSSFARAWMRSAEAVPVRRSRSSVPVMVPAAVATGVSASSAPMARVMGLLVMAPMFGSRRERFMNHR